MNQPKIPRRSVLAGGGAGLLTGIIPSAEAKPGQIKLAVGDAHVHLFNAADLPVVKFFDYVLAPVYLSNWPQFVLAFLDIALKVLKAFSTSASDELRQTSSNLSARQFADKVADLIEAQTQGKSFDQKAVVNPESDLAESYRALASALQTSSNFAKGRSAALQGVVKVDRDFLSSIAKGNRRNEFDDFKFKGISLKQVFALIAWSFRMTHSRRRHLRDYMKLIESSRTSPKLLVNLLVDYDRWLDDSPKAGSDQRDQVRFWASYSRGLADRIRIETFAGYDPLQHAEQSIEGRSDYFDRLKSWALAGPAAAERVAGFKLYPPMGFNVDRNRNLPAQPERAAKSVDDRWRERNWDRSSFGKRLDGALDTFFDFATANDIPLLAHARNSNDAYPWSGGNAHPSHWLERAVRVAQQGRRLRVCLGHYRHDFDWPPSMRRMLEMNLSEKANIYFDMGYDNEIIDNPEAARRIIDAYMTLSDNPAIAKWLLFGTDWIMLGQEPRHKTYLASLEKGIAASTFWRDNRAMLLGENLERFLKIRPE